MSTNERRIVRHTRGKTEYWEIEFKVDDRGLWISHHDMYRTFDLAKKMYDVLAENDITTETVVYP